MVMVNVDGSRSVQVGWLGLRVGGHMALSLHSSNEPGELSQWPRHNDSTINTIIGITIVRSHRTYYVRRCGLLLPTV